MSQTERITEGRTVQYCANGCYQGHKGLVIDTLGDIACVAFETTTITAPRTHFEVIR